MSAAHLARSIGPVATGLRQLLQAGVNTATAASPSCPRPGALDEW